jgi:hypothetical protein
LPSANIVNRATKALAFLGEPWLSYVDPETQQVRWADVTIAGHYNGADHAGFLAKNFNVSRALLLAGPNDSVDARGLDGYFRPVPWIYSNWTSNVTGQSATLPSRLYGFGVCGTPQHPADLECFGWHPNWQAMGIHRPWFKADGFATLAEPVQQRDCRACAATATSRGSGYGYNHMASAADCCLPRFPFTAAADLAGRILWTKLWEHMLTNPTGTPPPAPAPAPPGNGSSCSCAVCALRDRSTRRSNQTSPATTRR